MLILVNLIFVIVCFFRDNSAEISRTVSRKFPGNLPEISRKVPGNFPDKARTLSGNVPDICGAFPRNLLNVLQTSPSGNFPEVSRNIRDMSTAFPIHFPDISDAGRTLSFVTFALDLSLGEDRCGVIL